MSYITANKETAKLEDIEHIYRTDNSVLIRYDITKEIWLPIQHIEDSGPDWVEIPLWLAKDKGLI